MQIYEYFLIAVGIASGITAIWKLISLIVEKIKKCISFFTDLKKEMETVEQHCLENYITDLKLIIMSEEMPLGERLQAGEKYVNLGQNGEIKAKYKLLKNEYQESNEKHAE